MSKFIKIGQSHIRADLILAVRVHDATEARGAYISAQKACVIVDYGSLEKDPFGGRSLYLFVRVDFDSNEERNALADQIMAELAATQPQQEGPRTD